VFTYDLETNTYGKPPASYIATPIRTGPEKLILDFGDVFLLKSFIEDLSGLAPAIREIGYGNPDTLISMICYYILCSHANSHANTWWSGSYARIAYPNANLTSQRKSEFLEDIRRVS
jgi:hypothetical protein